MNHRHQADISEALQLAKDEMDVLALELGTVISEKVSDHAIDKAVENIKADPFFKNIQERDIKDLVVFLVGHHGESVAFSPDVLTSFFKFSKNIGFPATLGAAEKAGLKTDKYSTKTLLNLLVGTHVLTVIDLPGSDVIDYAKQHSEENKSFRENPDQLVDVYELHPDFTKELGYLLRDLKTKEECISGPRMQKRLQEQKEIAMEPLKRLLELESRLAKLHEKDDEELEADVIDPDQTSHEEEFFKKYSDDMVEDFIDGILIVLSKFEQNGQIPRIESPQQARQAVLAAVRRMYQKRGLISKLSSKFARYGSKRELRKAKQSIQKALS